MTPRTDTRIQRRATAMFRLGNRLCAANQFSGASSAYRHALALEPKMAAAWHNLGHLLHLQQDYGEARTCYQRALLFSPDDPDILNNLGVLYREMGLNAESRNTLEYLVYKYPDDGDAHWNLALTLLQGDNFQQGWSKYEWRFQRSIPVKLAPPESPRWCGGPVAGKRILVCCEQAYGDMIQFARFIPLLSDRGARVILQCPDRSIADLLANAPGVDVTVLRSEAPPLHDGWVPLLSLPMHLETVPFSIPAPPYLISSPTSQAEWLDIKAETSRLKVGLVWSGRKTDLRRTYPVAELEHLAGLRQKMQFYSLQVGASQQDIALLSEQLGIIDLAPRLTDFTATAAAMTALDLIISIDSAPAHLAGALGCETWLLLSNCPDWRWSLERNDSLWYPSMRLFRQQRPGDWASLLDNVASALEQRSAHPARSSVSAIPQELLELGDRLREQEAWTSACWAYRNAELFEPAGHQAALRAGGCLLFLNRFAEAAEQFRNVIAMKPEQPDAHINLGLTCLATGNLREGWQEFEWRRSRITTALPPWPDLPPIGPDTDLSGASVLVHAEQGFGDLFQFARYLPILAETGARIVMTVPESTAGIFRNIRGVHQVVPHGSLLPRTDYQTLLLSLPLLLLERNPEIPRPEAYLSPDRELADHWLERMGGTADTMRVGLVWSGREMRQSGYRRSLSPELLAPLNAVPGITLYSLQLAPPDNLQKLLPEIIDLGAGIWNFDDTAAIIANLDLLITVDTSVAHLAGAMGRPAWVALLFSTDWRWNSDHNGNNPWYSSLCLFRQPRPGAWEPVISKMALLLHGESLICRGHKLGRAGRRTEAIAAFHEAANLAEAHEAAFLNLGIYLRADGQPYEAREALLRATEIDPAYPEAWQNLGLAHQDLGELPEAYTCMKKALALRPDYPTARWNLGLLQLLIGEYRQGFCNLEARFEKLGAIARLHQETPRWNGSGLNNRTILVHAEQGYGDTLQFVRFIPLLADMGATVILEVQDRLLLETCRTVPGASQMTVRGELPPPLDLQIPLLSLPHLLGSTIETIPRKIPYLTADKNKVAVWQQRLPGDKRPRIGICWKGRSTPDPRRSIPFAGLAPLLRLSGICWVSLQIDKDGDALLPEQMLDLTDGIRDFSDSAALISCLDLIITIDSAMAHLAGAMGRPGIVLLPFAPDWRWTLDRKQTPWYPSLQLLRQEQPGNWGEAIHHLIEYIDKTEVYRGADGSIISGFL